MLRAPEICFLPSPRLRKQTLILGLPRGEATPAFGFAGVRDGKSSPPNPLPLSSAVSAVQRIPPDLTV
jgi:hypothetical protein